MQEWQIIYGQSFSLVGEQEWAILLLKPEWEGLPLSLSLAYGL